mmetsp:Transcript_21490/g.52962  ORF Transcript_21490/g.52962 Transcript_21490/m.52962 type:complete len:81 (-) Transcript_21490:560-802(-)
MLQYVGRLQFKECKVYMTAAPSLAMHLRKFGKIRTMNLVVFSTGDRTLLFNRRVPIHSPNTTHDLNESFSSKRKFDAITQ